MTGTGRRITMKTMRVRVGWAASATAAAALVAGCTHAAAPASSPVAEPTSPALGTVVGSFRAGAGPDGGSGGPLPGVVTVRLHTIGGRVVASAHADTTGRFHFALRPGRYALSAIALKKLPCHVGPTPPQRVNVVAGHVARVVLICPVG